MAWKNREDDAELMEAPAMDEDHAPAMDEAQKPSFDPGLTQTYTGSLKRIINKDGQFNVRRGGRTWRDWHPYLVLISTSWPRFILMVTAGFLIVNTLFALSYAAAGLEHLRNADAPTEFQRFMNAFFFSAHTLTTVGYGNMWPIGPVANSIAVLELLSGVLGFAIATGLLFGRFSRPSARFGFSDTMIVAPYKGGTSLQFRLVNRRTNNIVDLEVRLLLMQVELCGGKLERKFLQLDLERSSVLFFPLTWTVVHPITQHSPLFGKTAADLEGTQAEVMILLKGFDDTFGQAVQTRYSYRYDEIVWGAKFTRAFEVEPSGDLLIEVDKVSDTEPADLPTMAVSA
ncbi:MAG TPA: ion channel [Bryobacteraceae bacterium]|nr:ion channel [Bryobacteraceae bacterium]